MKKLTAALICLIGTAVFAHATISIEVDAGILRNLTGTAIANNGGLLQLVTSPSGATSNISAPTSSSFVSGDNIVVGSQYINANFGTGHTDNFFTITLQNTGASTPTTFDSGDPLVLRWYPGLTPLSSAPGIGATYGQFSTTGTADGTVPYTTPANGSSISLVFNTMAAGGSQVEIAGNATNVVIGVVPEPSTYATLACGLASLVGLSKLRRGVTAL